MVPGNHLNKLRVFFITYLILYVVIKIAFIFSGHDLFSEESQYWLWSQHLDWSYYSKPPLIAWINFVTQQLFGHSDVVIRFTALGFGLATLVPLYFAAIELFDDRRIAMIAVQVVSISPYFVLASTFFTTDTLMLFFWALTLYLFLKGLKSNSLLIWFIAGVSFGLGCLSKYTMVFFVLIILIPFLWGTNKATYIRQLLAMCLVALIINVPVIWWNYMHGWISIKHVNALAYGGTGVNIVKSLKHTGEFLGGVVLINSPFLFILFLNGLSKGHTKYHHDVKQKVVLLIFPVVFTVFFFLLLSVFSRVEVNWPSMAYLGMPLVIAYFIVIHNFQRSYIISSSLTAVLLLFLLFPILQDKAGLSSIIPIRFDSLKRMAGWKELSAKVQEIKNNYQEEQCVFIFSSSYHIASSVSFYMNSDEVFCIEINRRRNQFDLWKNINQYENTCCYGIFISDQLIPEAIFKAFEGEIEMVKVPIHYRGHIVRNFNIYVLKNFSGWHNHTLTSF